MSSICCCHSWASISSKQSSHQTCRMNVASVALFFELLSSSTAVANRWTTFTKLPWTLTAYSSAYFDRIWRHWILHSAANWSSLSKQRKFELWKQDPSFVNWSKNCIYILKGIDQLHNSMPYALLNEIAFFISMSFKMDVKGRLTKNTCTASTQAMPDYRV